MLCLMVFKGYRCGHVGSGYIPRTSDRNAAIDILVSLTEGRGSGFHVSNV